jgi:hypothetical protein
MGRAKEGVKGEGVKREGVGKANGRIDRGKSHEWIQP